MILLVDNSVDYRASLRCLLQLEGYACEVAESYEEAIGKLADKACDLAIVDLRLSNHKNPMDLTGLQLTEWFRDNRPGTPVIVMSAYLSDETVRAAMRDCGAAEIVWKGDGPSALLEAVRHALAPTT